MNRSTGLNKSIPIHWLVGLAVPAFATSVVIICGALRSSSTTLAVPERIEFGSVAAGKHSEVLELVNPTNRDILIEKVTTSCGCTVTDLETPAKICPGETLDVKVRFDGTGMYGPVQKRIVFYTDEEVVSDEGELKNVAHVTHVFADVMSDQGPYVTPPVVRLGSFGAWEKPVSVVTVLHRNTQSCRIISLPSAQPGIKCIAVAGADGWQQPIKVTVDGSKATGKIDTQQRVITSCGEVQFQILGHCQAGCFLESSLLVFDYEAKKKQCRAKTISLHYPPSMRDSVPHLKVSVPSWNASIANRHQRGIGIVELELVLSRDDDLGEADLLGPISIIDTLQDIELAAGRFLVRTGKQGSQDALGGEGIQP